MASTNRFRQTITCAFLALFLGACADSSPSDSGSAPEDTGTTDTPVADVPPADVSDVGPVQRDGSDTKLWTDGSCYG
jgi:hypothetical protein